MLLNKPSINIFGKYSKATHCLFVCFPLLFLLISCGTAPPPEVINENESVESTEQPELTTAIDGGYPDSSAYPVDGDAASYPEPDIYQDLLDEPPNVDVELPEGAESIAVIGGVLIREVSGEGFEPLVPLTLSLADIVLNSEGKAAFITAGDESPKAELYPTGIFIFNNVPPGTYGFMVDVGYTEFFIKDDAGNPMLIEVEAGDIIDLNQVITTLP